MGEREELYMLHKESKRDETRAINSSPLPDYIHRHNNDETFDSICTRCVATIGSTHREQDLGVLEQEHNCVKPWSILGWL
jgi:hypothetical protein